MSSISKASITRAHRRSWQGTPRRASDYLSQTDRSDEAGCELRKAFHELQRQHKQSFSQVSDPIRSVRSVRCGGSDTQQVLKNLAVRSRWIISDKRSFARRTLCWCQFDAY